MPLTGINQKSIFYASNGRVYIGGVDGLISFFPEELESMTSEFQVFPSKLYVNDKEIQVNDDSGILTSALSETQSITLKHGQNMFSLLYSITNYVPVVHANIVYRLENFSDTWMTLPKGQIITYTNLDPGSYVQ